jgi:phospholipid/cholesterol/gamma-HCH transport system substrate-binding protein
MSNLQQGTKGLSENMEAAKSNILLRGYFKKKKKADAKKQADLKKEADRKAKKDLKKVNDGEKKDAASDPLINAKDSITQ